MRLLLASALLAGVSRRCDAAPAADAVGSLPGYGAPPTKHYSGFLNVRRHFFLK